MPRIDLVLALIRSGSRADVEGVRSAAEAIINEETQRGRSGVVERIRNALAPTMFEPGSAAPSLSVEGVLVGKPASSGLTKLELDPRCREELFTLVKEHGLVKKLAAKGLAPRHKVLLSGPPGNGKTSVAEALAHDLRLPFYVVSYGSLIGSLLGETNKRIEAMFAHVASRPCVLFFDEFEAIGKERADRQEAGEMKRAVASLLTNIDSLPSSVIVVAATNHPEMLDRAVWRRFDVRLVLDPPSTESAVRYIATELGMTASADMAAALSACFGTSSYAELKDFTLDVRRRSVLESVDASTAMRRQLKLRFPNVEWPIDADRSNATTSPPKPTKKRRPSDGEAARNSRQ